MNSESEKSSRSEMMSKIRSFDTKPELMVRYALYRVGYRYRLKDKILGIQPDIVLRKQGVVIFVHGCFWHRHLGCKLAYNPKSRTEFWETKFKTNIERDRRVIIKLQLEGWRVAIIWECVTRDKKLFPEMMDSLDSWIQSDSEYFES